MDLVSALEATEAAAVTPKCSVCQLPYLAEVDKALRIAKTGRWNVMQVFQTMQKMHGFKGGYETVRRHYRSHLGPTA